MNSPYEDLIERLEAIEEELRDRAYERLTAAAASPGSEEASSAEAEEKRLLVARRAIAKAINSLQVRR
jgi:predicted nucleotidyltransferase